MNMLNECRGFFHDTLCSNIECKRVLYNSTNGTDTGLILPLILQGNLMSQSSMQRILIAFVAQYNPN